MVRFHPLLHFNKYMSKLDDLQSKLKGEPIKKEVMPVVIQPIPQIKKKKGKGGRPTVMTKENFQKIEEVAALGGSVEEMASYCDISAQSIYWYLTNTPEYSDKIERLRERPILKARNTAVSALSEIGAAHWYLERKRPKEFSTKVEVDLTTKVLQIDI